MTLTATQSTRSALSYVYTLAPYIYIYIYIYIERERERERARESARARERERKDAHGDLMHEVIGKRHISHRNKHSQMCVSVNW